MIDKSIFAAVAACAVVLSSPFADGEELYDFEFLHLEKAVGRYNDDPGPRLDPGSRPGTYPVCLGRTAHLERSRAGGPTKASGPRIGVGAVSGRLIGSGAVGEDVNDGRSIEPIEVVS